MPDQRPIPPIAFRPLGVVATGEDGEPAWVMRVGR